MLKRSCSFLAHSHYIRMKEIRLKNLEAARRTVANNFNLYTSITCLEVTVVVGEE
jgi:hypothetical protein